jgi:hypothetical protein
MNALYRLSAALIARDLVCDRAAWAQQPDPHADDRAKLRAMLAEFEAAINAQSIDRMVAEMADDVTVIWLNAEVSRGKGRGESLLRPDGRPRQGDSQQILDQGKDRRAGQVLR